VNCLDDTWMLLRMTYHCSSRTGSSVPVMYILLSLISVEATTPSSTPLSYLSYGLTGRLRMRSFVHRSEPLADVFEIGPIIGILTPAQGDQGPHSI